MNAIFTVLSLLLLGFAGVDNDLLGTWVLPTGIAVEFEESPSGGGTLQAAYPMGEGVYYMALTVNILGSKTEVYFVTPDGISFKGELGKDGDVLEGTCTQAGKSEACSIRKQIEKE